MEALGRIRVACAILALAAVLLLATAMGWLQALVTCRRFLNLPPCSSGARRCPGWGWLAVGSGGANSSRTRRTERRAGSGGGQDLVVRSAMPPAPSGSGPPCPRGRRAAAGVGGQPESSRSGAEPRRSQWRPPRSWASVPASSSSARPSPATLTLHANTRQAIGGHIGPELCRNSVISQRH
jgi:hypothetical protein